MSACGNSLSTLQNDIFLAVAGALTGYLTMKAARIIAFAAGLWLFLLETLHRYGVLDIDYDSVIAQAPEVISLIGTWLSGSDEETLLIHRGFLGGLLLGASFS